MPLPLSLSPLGPPLRRPTPSAQTLAPPNHWVPARAVLFLPRQMDPTIAKLLREADPQLIRMGWTHQTWRTARADGRLSLPEKWVGRATPDGECVVAVLPLRDTRLRQPGFAAFLGEVVQGSASRDAVLAHCAELEDLGLRSDLWVPLPTIR
jgi:hypothetical protein